MIFLLIIILIIAIIFILVFFINVKIAVKYKINGLDDKTVIVFSILRGIIKYTYEPKEKEEKRQEKDDKKRTKLDGINSKIDNVVRISKIIVKIKVLLREKIILKRIVLYLDFGVGDAFYTGILSGLIWSLVGVAVSYVSETFEVCEKNIKINPKFSENTFVGKINCIFSIKIVYIITVAVKLYMEKLMKRNRNLTLEQ